MSEYQIRYDRSRFPVQPRREDGAWGCRGCGGELPKGKGRAWCGRECRGRYHPGFVKEAVKQRDKGICQLCGHDHVAARAEWVQRCHAKQYPIDSMIARDYAMPASAEYDHIIPMCEGGLTVLENMRTLCRPCHHKMTLALHRRRTQARTLAWLRDEGQRAARSREAQAQSLSRSTTSVS